MGLIFRLSNWLNSLSWWKITAFGSLWWRSSKCMSSSFLSLSFSLSLSLSLSVWFTMTLFPQGFFFFFPENQPTASAVYSRKTDGPTQLVRFHRGLPWNAVSCVGRQEPWQIKGIPSRGKKRINRAGSTKITTANRDVRNATTSSHPV